MSISGVRLLLVLPQLPQDPASGAARSVRTICEMLAQAGVSVRAVATTASERAVKTGALAYLEELGISPQIHPGRTNSRVRPEYEFTHRHVHYRLLDTGDRGMMAWEKIHGKQFDILFDDELRTFRPDLVFGYGGQPGDARRFERARRQIPKIVFGLRNEAYLSNPPFLAQMDGILTPSQFLTDFYRNAIGIESTPLPIPIEREDVVADARDPIFFTMVNPSQEKGLMVLARLAEEVSVRRPDIPFLIVESRGSGGKLIQAGLLGGFDLRRHENLMLSPPMAQPKDIYVPTRALLAPSLWQEAAGRVVAEALLNGIPPLVSDRGGLSETCNGAGFTLPMPAAITPYQPVPVTPEVVEPWIDLILRLADDEEFYRAESRRALEASSVYRPENLAPRYVDYFLNVLENESARK